MKRALASIALLALLTGCANSQAVKPLPQDITIAFGGDTNGIEHVSTFLNKGGDPFAGVASVLKKADISVINLESAITTQTAHQEKQYFFNSNPQLLDAAQKAGVDVVNIGNNHAGDYLRAGVTDTIKAIEDRGMKVIGGGNSGREAWSAKIIKVRDTKVALLGIAKINGGAGTVASGEYAGTTDGWDPTVIELAIKAAARQAKIVIVYTHWGVEEATCPEKGDVVDAQKWLEWGATAVIGSHSHRQQPAVRYGSKIVDYSLGNFAFYVRSGAGLQSGVGYLTVTPDGVVKNYQFLPALISSNTGAAKFIFGKEKSAAIAAKQACKVN